MPWNVISWDMLYSCNSVMWYFVSDSSSPTKNKDLEKSAEVGMKNVEDDTEDDELINM